MIMAIRTPTGDRIVDFEKEGVTFIFPPLLDFVHVARLELPDEVPVGRDPSEFDPKRRIIKVKLYKTHKDKKTIEPIVEFPASFKIEIHYNEDDEKRAAEHEGEMVCAYYDNDEKVKDWIPFTWDDESDPQPYDRKKPYKNKKQHNYKGFGVTTIREWPDPEMGWGP
jgi:hypothetical protein